MSNVTIFDQFFPAPPMDTHAGRLIEKPKVHALLRLCALVWTALLVGILSTTATYAQLPADFVDEAVISGLNQPISMRFLPDGRALIIQKGGGIVIADPSQGWGTAPYMTLTNIESGSERGLLDFALDPNFGANGYFYLYYSPSSPEKFRIARFTHQENSGGLTSTGDLGSETVIWEEQWPGDAYVSCCHYGGGLDFGPDGKIYLTTGDKFNGTYSQDRTRSAGSVIRVNPDGTIPADNPYVGNQNGWDESIWAYGLRNPYRARWDLTPGEERLFIGEVGGNDQEKSWEDLHLGEAGANYGWPFCEGPFDNPDLPTDFPACNTSVYTGPLYAYDHTSASPNGGSITGGFVYRGNAFPSSYYGAYFFGDYALQQIRYLTFDPNDPEVVTGDFMFQPSAGPIVALEHGLDGALYYVGIFGSIRRIVYNGLSVSASATPTSGLSPLIVSFDGSAVGGSGMLTYTWFFGDGTDSGPLSDPATPHLYASDGVYSAVLQVTDGVITSTSEAITIEVGEGPTATILSPTDGMLFRAGDIINFSGDADGGNGQSTLSWTVRFGHNAHFHPVLDNYIGASGSFAIPTSGHDYADETRYQLELTATDESGLTDTDTLEIFPDKVNVTYDTAPAAIPITIDDLTHTPPYVIDDLKGFERTVSVPESHCVDGTAYAFDSWSDGGAREHMLTIPDVAQSYTATFTTLGSCSALAPYSEDLALQLESDADVTTNGTTVMAWGDQTVNALDLTAVGNPQLLFNTTPSGYPAIALDGSGDILERVGGLIGLPEGGAERAMFVVARYIASNGARGGVAYGDAECGETFGLVVDGPGDLRVQRWCNDHKTTVDGVGAGWLLHSAVVNSASLTQYKDGELIGAHDLTSNPFITALDRFVIGEQLDGGGGEVNMEIAAVLLYDRGMSPSERAEVEAYLHEKYLEAPPPPATVTITSPSDGETIFGSDVTVSWSATAPQAGDHVHLTLDGSSEHVTVMQLEGSYTFTGLAEGAHTVTAAVASSGHTVYPGSDDTVTFTVTDEEPGLITNGLVVHLESDLNVTTNGGNVGGWLDQSGNGNDLSAGGDPQLVTAATPSGQPAIAFDGAGDHLARVASLNNLPAGAADRSMFVVARYRSNGYGGIAYGPSAPSCGRVFGLVVDNSGNLAVQRWCGDYKTSVPGNGAGWLLQAAVLDGASLLHYKDGELIGSSSASFDTVLERFAIGEEIDGSPDVAMDVAAVLVYDRALSEAERAGVEAYLQEKYLMPSGNTPPVIDPIADVTVEAGETVGVTVVASDADGEVPALSIALTAAGGAVVPATAYTFTDNGDGSASLTWVTSTDDVGSYTATVTADDGTGTPTATSSSTFAIEVTGPPVAAVTIEGPADGATIFGSSLTVSWSATPEDADDHVHVALDGDPYVGGQPLEGSYTFAGVAPGAHTVRVSVANLSHVEYANAEARDSVAVTVEEVGAGAPFADDLVVHLEVDAGVGTSSSSNASERNTEAPEGIGVISDGVAPTIIRGSENRAGIRSADGIADDNVNLRLGEEPADRLAVVGSAHLARTDSPNTSNLSVAVSGWLDQSGNGNDLSAGGDPQLVTAATPSGQPAIAFDGAGDHLARVASLNNLPAGAADRSMFVVARYRSNGYGGIAYGPSAPSCGRVFGLVVDNSGNLAVQRWCGDYKTSVPGNGAGWLLQAAVLDGASLLHYKDGELIGSSSASFDTVLERFAIGEEIDGSPDVAMDVAAVLVYDRALSEAERAGVEAYLQEKYLMPSGNTPPVIDPIADVTVEAGETVGVTVVASDADGEVPALSIALTAAGGAVVPATAYTFTDNGDGSASLTWVTSTDDVGSYTATVTADDGTGTPTATSSSTFAIEVTGPPVAAVTIEGPADGATIFGSSLTVSWSATPEDADDHVHVALDGDPYVGGQPLEGSYTFAGVAPGAHTVRVSVANLSHVEYANAEARDSVAVTVEEVGAGAPFADDLSLRFESDEGLTVSGGTVAAWSDLSGNGNDLTASGDPALEEVTTPSGLPAVAFDGTGDKLERVGSLTGLPAGGADRTMFVVANYESNGYGGVAYGKNACGQTFGLIVSNTGNLTVQRWCGDYKTTVAGNGAGWLVQSAVLSGTALDHYQNGVLIKSNVASFNTVVDRLVLGAEIDSSPMLDMDVAAVLVYDRALSESERQQVEAYLQQKYMGSGLNVSFLAVDDAATVEPGAEVVVDVLANDMVPSRSTGLPGLDQALTDSRPVVTVVAEPHHGSVRINAATGAITYIHDGSSATSDTFTYAVQNAAATNKGSGTGNTEEAASGDSDTSTLKAATVTISVRPSEVTLTETFDEGWHLVSLGVSVPNPDYLVVFEAGAGGDPQSPVFVDAATFYGVDGAYVTPETSELSLGTGAWLRFAQEAVVTTVGTRINEVTVPIREGWMIVSGPSCELPVEVLGEAIDIVSGTVYGFDGSYYQPNSLRPGTAYWVQGAPGAEGSVLTLACAGAGASVDETEMVAAAASLVKANATDLTRGKPQADEDPSGTGGVRKQAIESGPPELDGFARLRIEDADGDAQALYFAGTLPSKDEAASFALPPVPPQGSFDARFDGDTRLVQREEAVLSYQTEAYPLRVAVEALPETGATYALDILHGESVVATHTLEPGASVEIAERGATVRFRVVEAFALPEGFALIGAYPNPFNREAAIVFDLPEAADVRVELYDLLGRRVAVVAEEKIEAGAAQEVRLRASGLASGPYFYRLTATMASGPVVESGRLTVIH